MLNRLSNRDREAFDAYIAEEYEPALEMLTEAGDLSFDQATKFLDASMLHGCDLISEARNLLRFSRNATIIPMRKDCE